MTDGHLRNRDNTSYMAEFYVGELIDAQNIIEDIRKLGFCMDIQPRWRERTFEFIEGNPTKQGCYCVMKGGAFAHFMHFIGVPSGHKGRQIWPGVPQWIMEGNGSIQQEFLSAVEGGDGSAIGIHKTKPYCGKMIKTCLTEYKSSNIAYFEQLKSLFAKAGIVTHVGGADLGDKYKVHLCLETSYENLHKYGQYITFTYSAEKCRSSEMPLQYIAYYRRLLQKRKLLQHQVRRLSSQGRNQQQIARHVGLSHQIVSRWLSNKKAPSSLRITKDPYDTFKQNMNIVGNVCVQEIVEIQTVAKETVYDFTTESDNHSFIANGIVVSNCPSETPEGAQCGLVKNLSIVAAVSLGTVTSWMSHITINLLLGTPKYPILRLLDQTGITRIFQVDSIQSNQTRILVNSDLYGNTFFTKEA
jgi:predicted transcriptional regulator